MTIKESIAIILEGIAKQLYPPVPKPQYTQYQTTWQAIFNLCDPLTSEHVYMWDSTYWMLSLDDWKKVINEVRQSLPVYVADRFDCEDYAMLVMTRVTERYEINTMGVVVGKVPAGEHGFNVFVACEDGKPTLHVLEPQTGQIDPPDYIFETVIFC